MHKFGSQINTLIKNLKNLLNSETLIKDIDNVIFEFVKCFEEDKPVLIFGNGGSASDALHISGELVGRFLKERRALNVICLNSNAAVITAWSNDYNFETVFSRQIEAHGQKGGICFGISTSGHSKNVINGMFEAKKNGMKTICLTGNSGGELVNICDFSIVVPSAVTPEIQEMHLPIYHYICEEIEKNLFKN